MPRQNHSYTVFQLVSFAMRVLYRKLIEHELEPHLARQLQHNMSDFRGQFVRIDDLILEFREATWILLVEGTKLLGSMRVFAPSPELRQRVGYCDYVSAFVITASERGRGLSQKLLKHAKRFSAKPLVLDVETDHKQAIIAYLKADFLPVSIDQEENTMMMKYTRRV